MAGLSSKEVKNHVETKGGNVAPATSPDERNFMKSTVDNSVQPMLDLSPFVEGYQSWTIEYVSAILHGDEELSELSMSSSAVLQQYLRIRGMEIKVTSPIEYTYEKERQSDTFKGSGVIYAGIVVPKRMDHFIADIGANLPFLFTITNVEPKSIYGNKAYEIEYSSSGRLTPERRIVLEKKIVETKHYVKDYLNVGKNPLLSNTQLTTLESFKSHGTELIEMYMQDFIATSRERYLLIPDQVVNSLDIYLQDAISNILDTSSYPLLKTINQLSLDVIPEAKRKTIWDIIMGDNTLESKGLVHRIASKMQLFSTRATIGGTYDDPRLRSLYYSTVQDVYLPPDALSGMATGRALIDGKERIKDMGMMLMNQPTIDPEIQGRKIIHKVTCDDYYVLSEAFYNSDISKMSRLEFQVTQMLNREHLNHTRLLEMCEHCYTWGSLERYYYTPILLILLKYAMVEITS